ncbi:DNA polymerase-3 subunit epsilon [Algoriphagus sp. 4150]|uniref:3'-5' exonuclease n=1 Tax=Algoriphagus sp. 4150 TaxID=2817756 RepID=UPI002854D9AD|nr:3'-5' exonuclease [Algoriphagus sp. 4150]MDR7128448.1 DNA polymerase-3 subunit epsilon [Algoriphagus sp. 4150]
MLPDFVKGYLAKNELNIPPIRALNQLDFVVLDTETTGLDTNNDSIVSFGAVKISNERILVSSAVEWYPESNQSLKQSPLIHGLVERQNQLTKTLFIKQVLEYISNAILVGHHLGFDLDMLFQIAKDYGLTQFQNPIIDTMNFAIRLDHGPQTNLSHIQVKNYSLDALCERFNIPLDDRHTAAGDAHLTALLFLKLVKIAEAKGIKSYGQLLR